MQSLVPSACLLSLIALPWSSAHSQTLTRGPYLQMGSTSAMTIRWRTSSALSSVVRYGTSPDRLDQTASSPTSETEHEIRLTGLAANTQYYYSVGHSNATLAAGSDYFFVTSPLGAKPTRVWVLGDSGETGPDQVAVRDAYYNFTGTRHTDFWLMLGDNAYSDGTDAESQAAVFDAYPSMLRKSVLWPTFGNHDGGNADSQSGPYFDMFTLPRQAEAGGMASGTEAYYAFDYGNLHFICLDSSDSDHSSNGPMLTWLRQDLAQTTSDWVIAFWHHPPYSKGSHDSDEDDRLIEMRENAVPILEAGGVDLVLSGHSHSYERSMLINGHYGYSSTFSNSMIVNGGSGRGDAGDAYTKSATGPTPNAGAVYVVAGASSQSSSGDLNHPAMYVSMEVLGSVVLDFNTNRLDVQYVDSTGARLDYFTIVKGSNNLPATRIARLEVNGPDVRIDFTSMAGHSYAVERADSLHNSTWLTVASNVPGTGVIVRVADVGGVGQASRFYRVKSLSSQGPVTP